MRTNTKLNLFAYYISQYFWILYILIPILFAILFPKRTKNVSIFSSTSKFNKSRDPVIFAHVTDTHLNSLRPSSTQSFRQTFQLIKKISPEFCVLTGDIVDNYDSTSIPRYGEQSYANWKIYQEETASITDIPIIEVGGNHDMFGIKSALSQKNYLIDSSHSFNRNNTKSEDQFLVHSFQVGPSQTNIIAVNPFQFPTSHPPLLLYTTFSTDLLDLIQKEIDKSKNKSIIICHYPVGSIHSQKSSAGLKFTKMIGSQKSVLIFLSGHSHPKEPRIFHHGLGGIEILGTGSFQHSRFGIVTIDNDGISWSTINTDNPPKGVISYPIPMNQLSPNAIFNDKNTEIRVVMFSNRTDLSISFKITENNGEKVSNGFLVFSRYLPKGHALYTFPMYKAIENNGSYQITFSGDFEGFSEFVICNSFVSGGEQLTEYPGIVEMLTITFPLFALILIVITFIIPFNCYNCQMRLDLIEEWIENPEKKVNHWLFIFFGCFLLIRTRFQRMPKFITMFVFFSVIFCFIGPLMFFETEDLLGFIFSYGYFIDNRAIHSNYGIFYAYFYLGVVCVPMISICSSFGVKNWSVYQIGDFIFAFGGLVGDIIILIRLVHESVGSKLTATSISFFFIPLIFIILFSVWIFFFKKKEEYCKKWNNRK